MIVIITVIFIFKEKKINSQEKLYKFRLYHHPQHNLLGVGFSCLYYILFTQFQELVVAPSYTI